MALNTTTPDSTMVRIKDFVATWFSFSSTFPSRIQMLSVPW